MTVISVVLAACSGSASVRLSEAAMVTPDQLGERYLAVHRRMFRTVNDEMSGCGLSMARTKVQIGRAHV